MAPLGFKSVIFSGAPQDHGLPYLADPHWNRLWSAADTAGMSISFHLGSGNFQGRHFSAERVKNEPMTDILARLITMGFLDSAQHVTDLLHSGVLYRYPNLKFVAAESGIGWIPFVFESADYHYKEASGGHDRRRRPPERTVPEPGLRARSGSSGSRRNGCSTSSAPTT